MDTKFKQITEASFTSDVLGASRPVLVDYSAEWCGPCKMMAPALAEFAHQYADRLDVAKVDVDENAALAARYQVRGIPTLMLFKGGEVVASKVGAMSRSQLAAFIDAHL
ncbi:MAG: thioredoxin [Steroidobacteraceae bacterium]|jgi:thioredoxin 1